MLALSFSSSTKQPKINSLKKRLYTINKHIYPNSRSGVEDKMRTHQWLTVQCPKNATLFPSSRAHFLEDFHSIRAQRSTKERTKRETSAEETGSKRKKGTFFMINNKKVLYRFVCIDVNSLSSGFVNYALYIPSSLKRPV